MSKYMAYVSNVQCKYNMHHKWKSSRHRQLASLQNGLSKKTHQNA